MAHITPASPIASISGKFTRHDHIYIRVNKHTGQHYGVGLENPTRVDNPTEAQQQAQSRFRDTWQKVDALLSDAAERTKYEHLYHQHIAQSRKRHKQPCASLRTFVFRLLYPKQ